jgi:NTE family protein
MNHSLGIALSGGGARGIAHIGVLQALEDHQIYPDALSGASAGALVGTLYAAGKTPAEILAICKESTLLKLFRPTVPRIGLTDNSYLMEVMAQAVGQDDFAALKRPVYISVTNLMTGQVEIKHEGPLYQMVAASASIPVLFKGQEHEGAIYLDGGVLNNLPIEPLKATCRHVIGVNVTPIEPVSDLPGILEVAYRTLDLILWTNVAPRLRQCDVIIEPGAHRYGFFDLNKADDIFEAGYDAALRQIPQIHRLLDPAMEGVFMPMTHRHVRQPVRPQPQPRSWWAKVWDKISRQPTASA